MKYTWLLATRISGSFKLYLVAGYQDIRKGLKNERILQVGWIAPQGVRTSRSNMAPSNIYKNKIKLCNLSEAMLYFSTVRPVHKTVEKEDDC